MTALANYPLLTALLGLFCLAFVIWIASVVLSDASIVDIFWGPMVALAAVMAYAMGDYRSTRSQLMISLIVIWAARLAIYLAYRNVGHGEDARYRVFRRRAGQRFWFVSLGSIFLFQAALAWIVSMPALVVVARPDQPGWNILDGVGIALFVFGLAYETVADLQLARFRQSKTNSGAVLDHGLWRYSRHPNYFGEFCLWWGLGLLGLSGGGVWALLGPSLVSFLLLRLSGVPMLEKTLGDRRPGYDTYRRSTNAFFPGKPRQTTDAFTGLSSSGSMRNEERRL